MQIEIVKEGSSYAIHIAGPLTVRISASVITDALKAAMWARQAPEQTFWNVFSEGINAACSSAAQIAANPIVQQVLEQYEPNTLSPIEAADLGCQLADRVLQSPRHARALYTINAAASGDDEAIDAINELRTAAAASGNMSLSRKYQEIVQLITLSADRADLHQHMMNSHEIPPSYNLVYE